MNDEGRNGSGEEFDERRHNDFVYESGETRKHLVDTVPLDDIGERSPKAMPKVGGRCMLTSA